jgi:hypothetical protein
MKKEAFDKRGQVTIFIIVAVVIVAGIIIFFIFRSSDPKSNIPSDLRPAYDYYLSCVEDNARDGIRLLGSHGGYIYLPNFEPGSPYMPFSSQLDFFGVGIPYWLYISGNNMLKEKVPTKAEMEQQLNRYIGERISSCDFSEFERRGYDVYIEEGSAVTEIKDDKISIQLSNRLNIFYGNQSATVNNHEIVLNSKLGNLYNKAVKLYNFEKRSVFLEKYAVDVMRLYAPVDGVDISCAPKIFVEEDIRKDLYQGLEVNINSIKLKGDYYELRNKDSHYFIVDTGEKIGGDFNVMYSSSWPTRIEIYGDKVVEPIGVQRGLSMIGFCFIPYHLVYDINFPVMMQFYESGEMFQFPMVVIIEKSQARNPLASNFGEVSYEKEVCKHKNAEITVSTFDLNLDPVEANLQFRCLDSVCNIGKTMLDGKGDSVFKGSAPQCVNGLIVASAEGYANGQYVISTNREFNANILLKKEFEVNVDLGNIGGTAFVSFVSDDYSSIVMYPQTKKIKLIEGNYNVTVYVYMNSTLKIQGTNDRFCFDVPVEGVGGLVGLKEEKCYDMEIPSIDVEMAVVGGGKTQEFIIESVLSETKKLNINVPLYVQPRTLEDLQSNYILVDSSTVYIDFVR